MKIQWLRQKDTQPVNIVLAEKHGIPDATIAEVFAAACSFRAKDEPGSLYRGNDNFVRGV
ncbi:MAG: hypothetical protein GF398_00490 [Chitinivibrionales bacterium]|nr:hypothetical protein [Chitinivibrionales bacterium]